MIAFTRLHAALLTVAIVSTGAAAGTSLFNTDNLLAWCIVPFDREHRTPEQRAAMLKRLGITKLAYDWREKDIPTFDRELDALNANGIRLQAFWLTSGPDPAADRNVRTVLDFLKRRAVKTEIWYLFLPPKDFDSLAQDQKIASAAAAVAWLASEAGKIGCSVGLYNHGGWFGEPENQLAIMERVRAGNVGIVYNFHHGHAQIDRFAEFFPKILPHLMAVNVNGMRRDGPMILPVGEGDRELPMLSIVQRSGYHGPIGILCHREDADAEARLALNMQGLDRLARELNSSAQKR